MFEVNLYMSIFMYILFLIHFSFIWCNKIILTYFLALLSLLAWVFQNRFALKYLTLIYILLTLLIIHFFIDL